MPRIPELPVAGALTAADLVPIVQTSDTEQTTVADVWNQATDDDGAFTSIGMGH
jgi:hypothetical protein